MQLALDLTLLSLSLSAPVLRGFAQSPIARFRIARSWKTRKAPISKREGPPRAAGSPELRRADCASAASGLYIIPGVARAYISHFARG